MRDIALDVHIDFCEVAIAEAGEVRSAGRISSTRPEELELFAGSLAPSDRVALEVTGNAWAIRWIIEPHVAEVIVVSPNDTGIRGARVGGVRVRGLLVRVGRSRVRGRGVLVRRVPVGRGVVPRVRLRRRGRLLGLLVGCAALLVEAGCLVRV